MTPTNKLRWLKVPHKKGGYADLILQQWWVSEPKHYPNGFTRVSGEWRDVPIEVKND